MRSMKRKRKRRRRKKRKRKKRNKKFLTVCDAINPMNIKASWMILQSTLCTALYWIVPVQVAAVLEIVLLNVVVAHGPDVVLYKLHTFRPVGRCFHISSPIRNVNGAHILQTIHLIVWVILK